MPDAIHLRPAPPMTEANGLRLCHLDPRALGPLTEWPAALAAIAGRGFSHILLAPPFPTRPRAAPSRSLTHAELDPVLQSEGHADDGLRAIVRLARAVGLGTLLDVVLPVVGADGPLAEGDSPFRRGEIGLDPTRFDPEGEGAWAPTDPAALPRLIRFWQGRLRHWTGLGIGGFRLLGLDRLPAELVSALAGSLSGTGARLLGWMPGIPLPRLADFVGVGLDHVFSSFPWWDGTAGWFWREAEALAAIAPILHPLAADRIAAPRGAIPPGPDRLALAALLGTGWMASLADTDPATIRALNHARQARPALSGRPAPRPLGPLPNPGSPDPGPGLAFLRLAGPDPRADGPAALVLVGPPGTCLDPAGLLPGLGGYYRVAPDLLAPLTLPPEGFVCLPLHWAMPQPQPGAPSLAVACAEGRIGIENPAPAIDAGRFAIRRLLGERIAVSADLIADGHDAIAARLRVTGPDGTVREIPLHPSGNDRWGAEFLPDQLGRWHYQFLAWRDPYASFCDGLEKKRAAGFDLALEAEEGWRLLAAAADRGHPALGALLAATPTAEIGLLLAYSTRAAMAEADPREGLSVSAPFPVEIERSAARFAAWYELFPRSMAGDGIRHGTFDDVIAQLPRIAAMGFDVLYFPPIHPIGLAHRKGRNNSLTAQPGEPGSPYAIADHVAIHPELGDFAAFARLRDAARAHGLELALDFAIQCAPDHPWLTAHPGWFDWRPDGSIKYAENPPKKYQDIVNVDFYGPTARPDLWAALADLVLFWCDQGVRIFRVDNPHTKPLPFWEWMIATVRARHPDALFLAEAFTRPKMMRRLAKLGFSQSYTYFTWRHTKAEFIAYLTELATSEAAEYFRPHFFVNTPDINPPFLQENGRPGHLIRAALAATLSGLWGIYCGFELCEATPLPGREEYHDSEKYQLRAWDWDRPGHIQAEIARLNAIRRANPCLHTHLGLRFLPCDSDAILLFEKATPDRASVLLVAILLDAAAAHETHFTLPHAGWNLPEDAALAAEDLLTDARFTWHGARQWLRLEPAAPYAIWRVRPA